MKVTLLTGGTSSERAVAIASGAQMTAALRGLGYEVAVVDTARGLVSADEEQSFLRTDPGSAPPSLDELRVLERGMLLGGLGEIRAVREADVICLALHGGQGEDGTLQAVLDVLGRPYTGSGHLPSALAMDKDLAKRVFQTHAIPVPRWSMGPIPTRKAAALGWPVVVKPSKQGSTVGLSLVHEPADLEAAYDLALAYDDEIMVEEFIAGRELTVAVLGGRALPVGEIVPRHEIFDYECKYVPGMAEEIFPARLDEKTARRLQGVSLTAHRALKLGGYSRIDFRMSDDGDIFCLEANTLPGMTGTSLVPQAASAAGLAFPELCAEICRLALGDAGTLRDPDEPLGGRE